MFIELLQDEIGLSRDAADVVSRATVFVAILVITWLLRRIMDSVLPGLIEKFTSRTTTNFDDQLAVALAPPLRFLITLGGVGLAILSLDLPRSFTIPTSSIVDSLVAFAVFWALFRVTDPIGDLLAHLYQRNAKTNTVPVILTNKMAQVGKQITKGLFAILGFAAILDAWSIDVNGMIAGFGIAGAAVALATKDTLANLLGYFVILADDPFNEGEYIAFSDVSGTIEHIGFRSTRVRVLDQSLVTVPNNTLMNANITNWSRLTKRRLNMTLGIEYGSSPDQVLAVVQTIREMLQEHEAVEADSVVVQFTTFNDSTLDIIIICFMKIPAWGDFQAAKQDINLRIMRLLAERGVGIAFPTRTVIMERAAPASAAAMSAPKPEALVSTATDSPVPDDAADDAAEEDSKPGA